MVKCCACLKLFDTVCVSPASVYKDRMRCGDDDDDDAMIAGRRGGIARTTCVKCSRSWSSSNTSPFFTAHQCVRSSGRTIFYSEAECVLEESSVGALDCPPGLSVDEVGPWPSIFPSASIVGPFPFIQSQSRRALFSEREAMKDEGNPPDDVMFGKIACRDCGILNATFSCDRARNTICLFSSLVLL